MIGCWLLSACARESLQPIPLTSVFEDPQEVMSRFTQQLRLGQQGWEFGLDGRESGYYGGFLGFGANGVASFIMDRNPAMASMAEVSFRMAVIDNQPRMVFTGISEYTEFARTTRGIDTSFAFLAIRQDTVVLNGDRYGNRLLLTPARSGQEAAYRNNGMAAVRETLSALQQLPLYFKRLVYNGAQYDLYVNAAWRKVYIHYGGTQRFRIHESGFALTASGIRLQRPLIDGINPVFTIDDLAVDEPGGVLSASVNGFPVVLTNEATPSAYDLTAALRFYNNPFYQVIFALEDGGQAVERYSASVGGFTVGGTPDAYGVAGIPDFQFLALFHLWGGNDYGTLRIVADDQVSSYGPAVLRQFSDIGGMMRFVRYGDFGEVPESIRPVLDQTIDALTDPAGFFVVKSGPASYDLVSANDGRKWIRFQ